MFWALLLPSCVLNFGKYLLHHVDRQNFFYCCAVSINIIYTMYVYFHLFFFCLSPFCVFPAACNFNNPSIWHCLLLGFQPFLPGNTDAKKTEHKYLSSFVCTVAFILDFRLYLCDDENGFVPNFMLMAWDANDVQIVWKRWTASATALLWLGYTYVCLCKWKENSLPFTFTFTFKSPKKNSSKEEQYKYSQNYLGKTLNWVDFQPQNFVR